MFTKNKEVPFSSGILIENNLTITQPENKSGWQAFLTVVSQAAIILMGILGAAYAFISSFSIPHHSSVLMLAVLVSTILWMIAFSNPRLTKPMILVPSIIVLLLVLITWKEIKEGFVITANCIVHMINQQMNFSLYDYVTTYSPSEYASAVTIFFVFAGYVITGVLCWAVLRRHSFLIVLGLTLPF